MKIVAHDHDRLIVEFVRGDLEDLGIQPFAHYHSDRNQGKEITDAIKGAVDRNREASLIVRGELRIAKAVQDAVLKIDKVVAGQANVLAGLPKLPKGGEAYGS